VLALKTDRLMAFTDGVLAIAITIMVLGLRVPATPRLGSRHARNPAADRL
jgi:uncharacterized membrane protein